MLWKKQYMTYFNSEVNYNCIKRYTLIIDLINNCDESHWIKGKKTEVVLKIVDRKDVKLPLWYTMLLDNVKVDIG